MRVAVPDADDLVAARFGGAPGREHVARIDRVGARRRIGVATRVRERDRARRLAVDPERSDEQPARFVGQTVVTVADDRGVLRLREPHGRHGYPRASAIARHTVSEVHGMSR